MEMASDKYRQGRTEETFLLAITNNEINYKVYITVVCTCSV